jgi:hypothetical protein
MMGVHLRFILPRPPFPRATFASKCRVVPIERRMPTPIGALLFEGGALP